MTGPLVLDERGKLCPIPVISLGNAASDLPPGSTIIVLSDDPAAAQDIPAWCRMRAAALLGTSAATDGRGGTRYEVRLGKPA